MGKKLDERITKSANSLANELENYMFLQRLRDSGNESLITNFENRGFNTIRSKKNSRDYMEYYPSNEDILLVLQTISSFI